MGDEIKGYQIKACLGPGGCPKKAVEYEGMESRLEEQISKRKLKPFLTKLISGPLKRHHEFRISISDCPNACSQPQIADIGLLGACILKITEQGCNGCGDCVEVCKEDAISLSDKGPVIDLGKCLNCGQCIDACQTDTLETERTGYRIQVGGKLGRHPRLAAELPSIFSPDEVLDFIKGILGYYQNNCIQGERLGEILEREGLDDLETLFTSRSRDSTG